MVQRIVIQRTVYLPRYQWKACFVLRVTRLDNYYKYVRHLVEVGKVYVKVFEISDMGKNPSFYFIYNYSVFF